MTVKLETFRSFVAYTSRDDKNISSQEYGMEIK